MGKVLHSQDDISEEIKVLEKVNYQDFLKFKSKFVQTLKFEGVMCGHITKEDAQHYAEIIRESIKHKELSDEDKFYPRNMLKLSDKTVHTFQENNPELAGENAKVNPNSAIISYF